MDYTPNGEFGWEDRTVVANSPAAWQNPGGGFACALGNTWARRRYVYRRQVDQITCSDWSAPQVAAVVAPLTPLCTSYTHSLRTRR